MASDKVRQQNRSLALIAAIVLAGDLPSYLPGFQLAGKRAPACWTIPFAAQPRKPNKQKDVENALKEELHIKGREVRAKSEELKLLESELAKQKDDKVRDDEQHRREVGELKARLELGKSREAKLLEMSGERRTAITMSLLQSAPSMSDASRREISQAIDLFEDFEHEDGLRAQVKWGALLIDYDSWHLHYGEFQTLPRHEQKALKKRVEEEIKVQKTLFPIRKTVKQVCSKHLEGFVPETIDELAQGLSDMKDDECLEKIDKLQKAFFRRIACIFQELEKRGVDAEKVLLGSWTPMALIRALAVFRFLEERRAAVLGEDIEDRMDIGTMLSQAYQSIKDAMQNEQKKRWDELAASALPPPAIA